MIQPRSMILNNAALAPDLGDLQHDRDFTQIKAWMQHWPKLGSEQAKVNFLVMLKTRRDQFEDAHAGECFKTLAARWIEERLMP